MRDELHREWEGFGGTECRQNVAEHTNGAGMAGPRSRRTVPNSVSWRWYHVVCDGGGRAGFDCQLQKAKRRSASTPADRTGPRGPSTVRAPAAHSICPPAVRDRARGLPEEPPVASSAVAWGYLAGAAARPPRAIVFAEAAGSGEVSSCVRSPCVLMRLVPQYRRFKVAAASKFSWHCRLGKL